jgi:pimeloyl-ACP methyl ester carboxylesterase
VYADVNGLKMFYEIRGTSDPAKVPVVLLHGAISATGTSFGTLPDRLAQSRQVITVEQQGHGRTADIDRPMSVQAMADDTLALLANLGIGQADLFGYSLGAGIPILLIIGDSDIVTPEHAVAMFRLLGGGVLGDLAPMPPTRFAVLPGTSHIGVTGRADMLITMIPPFLDAP